MIPARKSGWIEIIYHDNVLLYLIPARKSGWIEIIPSPGASLAFYSRSQERVDRNNMM